MDNEIDVLEKPLEDIRYGQSQGIERVIKSAQGLFQ